VVHVPEEGGTVGGVGDPVSLVVDQGDERLVDLVVGVLLGDADSEVGVVGVRLLASIRVCFKKLCYLFGMQS